MIATPTVTGTGSSNGGMSPDRLNERRVVYEQAGTAQKVFLGVACASHFMVWEKQRHVLFQASLQWLDNGAINGIRSGAYTVGPDGRLPGNP